MKNPKEKLKRTICDCKNCTQHCYKTPGYTLPGEIDCIAAYLGHDDVEQFTEEMFHASTKTKVLLHDGQTCIVPTLVPKMNDGQCVFLNDNGKCSIHNVSPFGCAYFDDHQSLNEAYQNSHAGITYLIQSMQNTKEGQRYLDRWDRLFQLTVI